MNSKQMEIHYAYHFISEAIIIYLLILPFMYHHYLSVPYWLYIVIILALALLFTAFTRYRVGKFYYLISIPVIIMLFFIVKFPIGLSMTFARLLTWRYLAIRSEMYVKRENMYIIISLILTGYSLLVIHDFKLLYLFLVLLGNLLVGYILSNITATDKAEHKSFNIGTWPFLISIFISITVIVIFLSKFVKSLSIKLWDFIRDMLVFIIKMVLSVIPDFDIENEKAWENFQMEELRFSVEGELGPSIWKYVVTYGLTYILITVLIILFGVYMFVRQFRLRLSFQEEVLIQEHRMMTIINNITFSVKNLPKRLFKKPSHPVRKLVFDFERWAIKHKLGRRSSETIENWLHRIGVKTNFTAYQKVRYGNLEISELEIQDLTMELKKIMKSKQK